MNKKRNEILPMSRRKAVGILGLGSLAIQFQWGCSFNDSKLVAHEDEPIHYNTINEISKKIKSKEISSVELTQLILSRIETIDKELNSYITVMKQSALSCALELDNELESGKYRGPLHGVPIAVKDLLFTTNAPTTRGHSFMKGFIAEYNATVVERLEDAGAIIIGKLNMTEGAMGGYHSDYEVVKNPWGDWWTGFSSSGSGAATAAGLCFGSIGTDTGGSIRFPSLCNGIVGLKPSYGLVSRHGVLPLADSLDHVGPMTRSVEDAAIMLSLIAGSDPNDPSTDLGVVPDILGTLKDDISGLRIGIDKDYNSDGTESSMIRDIEAAVKQLEILGAEISPIKMPDKAEYGDAWFKICSKEASVAHQVTFPSKADEYGPYFREFLEIGSSLSDNDYMKLKEYHSKFRQEFRARFLNIDAIISPAGGIAKSPTEEMLKEGPLSDWTPSYSAQFGFDFGSPADLAGIPSLTLPCGAVKDRPPNGLQIMGGYLKEDIICRIGFAYEQATDWHNQHPDI